MPGFVLTYHSHHVVGEDYARNDHVALAVDLDLITEAGCDIVSLESLIDACLGPAEGDGDSRRRQVAITFDDGPIYDVEGFSHPRFGPQRGFLPIMRDFLSRRGCAEQPELGATSFVIASPEARRAMETSYDPAYTYVGPGALSDAWWNAAIDTGLICIANHSWDHLHPGLARVAHSRQVRTDFSEVLTAADADAQIAQAGAFIAERTRDRAAPFFAYPFGQYNAFLVERYLPRNAERLGLRAAFTVEPRPVTVRENRWALPRFVCGHDWTSPAELLAILRRD
ncbi:MAG TPA: polysaccharide deacetylase family protein [Casimicrobiaceae bacterium]|nr:polysaccharide deacetylase family protein [Casimicrobiaceae bacterium]